MEPANRCYTPVRAWLGATVALDITTIPPERLDAVLRSLTLTKTDYGTGEVKEVKFYEKDGHWLHVPRGWFLQSRPILGAASVEDHRSDGRPLPEGTRAHVEFGAHPFPPGQPSFIEGIVNGCKANGHGGIAVAPTRAGKTLCSLEAAARLGGSVLIIVDLSPLMWQFHEAITTHLKSECGIIKAQSFDWEKPFTIAMAQTLSRRALPDEVRNAWRTVIVDECQMAPCSQVWGALKRINARYVIGLSATPDRSDGLGDAVQWVIGPPLATLQRKLKASVHFMPVSWPYENARIRGPRGVMWTKAENYCLENPTRINLIVSETLRAVKNQDGTRRVLILCGLRDHIASLATVLRSKGISPGIFVGGHADKSEMNRDVVLATYGIAAKGIDFKPPPTLLILAGPRGDVRQAVGRVLQPQAPHTPMILDLTDWTPPLIKQAMRRREYYISSGFDLRNDIVQGAHT